MRGTLTRHGLTMDWTVSVRGAVHVLRGTVDHEACLSAMLEGEWMRADVETLVARRLRELADEKAATR